jgi:hypothetical protein
MRFMGMRLHAFDMTDEPTIRTQSRGDSPGFIAHVAANLGTNLIAIAIVASALVFASGATAQTDRDTEAKALFAAGREAFEAGRYDAALARWQEAYDLSHRPTLLYNLGLAADRLRQDDRALSSFRAYLDQVPQAENRAEVAARIRALESAKREGGTSPIPASAQTAGSNAPLALGDPALTRADDRTRAEDRPLIERWWFWASVGAVVAGGVITAVAASSGGEKHVPPFEGRTGVTVMAIELR